MLERVQRRLIESKGKWPSIARGADVDYFTVVRIGSGKAISPRYETIQKLADFFEAQDRAAA